MRPITKYLFFFALFVVSIVACNDAKSPANKEINQVKLVETAPVNPEKVDGKIVADSAELDPRLDPDYVCFSALIKGACEDPEGLTIAVRARAGVQSISIDGQTYVNKSTQSKTVRVTGDFGKDWMSKEIKFNTVDGVECVFDTYAAHSFQSESCKLRDESYCGILCKTAGLCTNTINGCVVSSEKECRESVACKTSGICSFDGSKCFKKPPELDCQSSTGCKEEGKCRIDTDPKGKQICVPTKKGCRASEICRKSKRCELRPAYFPSPKSAAKKAPERRRPEAMEPAACVSKRVLSEFRASRGGVRFFDDDSSL